MPPNSADTEWVAEFWKLMELLKDRVWTMTIQNNPVSIKLDVATGEPKDLVSLWSSEYSIGGSMGDLGSTLTLICKEVSERFHS